MIALLWAVATASLLGSLHCIGMCGPLVGFYCGSDRTAPARAHISYHASRLLIYSILGGIAGGLGSVVDMAGQAIHMHRAAALIGGVLLITYGVLSFFGHGQTLLSKGLLARKSLVRLRTSSPETRATVLGLLSGTLPCGWLWAFVVSAASTGSVAAGVLVMTAFWVGTVPALIASAAAWRGISKSLGKRLPKITAVLLILVGAAAITMRLPMLSAPADKEAPAESCHGHE